MDEARSCLSGGHVHVWWCILGYLWLYSTLPLKRSIEMNISSFLKFLETRLEDMPLTTRVTSIINFDYFDYYIINWILVNSIRYSW